MTTGGKANGFLTKREKGSLSRRRSVLRWYLLISRNATVPGLYLLGFRGVVADFKIVSTGIPFANWVAWPAQFFNHYRITCSQKWRHQTHLQRRRFSACLEWSVTFFQPSSCPKVARCPFCGLFVPGPPFDLEEKRGLDLAGRNF